MKSCSKKAALLHPALLLFAPAIFAFTSCSATRTKYPNYPRPQKTDGFYRQQQEVIENEPPPEGPPSEQYSDQAEPQEPDQSEEAAPNPPPSPAPMDGYPQGAVPGANDIPTAKPGKDGLVESPFAPGKQVDIQGFPPGAMVRDPYTNKIFIVPTPAQTPNQ